jgi:hypothetical protein
MTVARAPRGLDLDALIDEARRRARRRRVALAAATLAAAGAGIGLGVALTGGSGRAVPVPPGFTVIKARGPVAHAVIESVSSVRLTSLEGRERPASTTEEVWYDARGGLWHDIVRVDGRVRSDRAGTCNVQPKEVPCNFSYFRPFDYSAGHGYDVTGKGTFRGVPVIWLESKAPASNVRGQVGVDARTHRLVVIRAVSGGRRIGDETVFSVQKTLPAKGVSFLVREHARGGAPNSMFEPFTGRLRAYGFGPARRALGSTPLWLGPRFHGYVLRSVQTGTYPFGTTKTGALRRTPFVRFAYGDEVDEHYWITVDEFGSTRPYFFKQGPRPGMIERDVIGMLTVRLTRGGLLLRITSDYGHFRLTRANAVALARSLRPLPPRLKTVPTLRQQ